MIDLRAPTILPLALSVFCVAPARAKQTLSTAAAPPTVEVAAVPAQPWIERRDGAQWVDFDLVATNGGTVPLRLCEVEVIAFDAGDRLLSRRTINGNGLSPGIDVVGATLLAPGANLDLFNPLDRFAAAMPLARLEYTLRFRREAGPDDGERNRHRLPLDFDVELHATVRPRADQPQTKLTLPLAGRLLVWDGHDLLSHHRRIPLDDVRVKGLGIRANGNRFAADLVVVDGDGKAWKGDPWDKRHWLSYGVEVGAPAAGTVVASANDIPDNEFAGQHIVYPRLPPGADDALGNFVVIDHGHGEHSVLPHLMAGSVAVAVGQKVRAGQMIGRVGFSGDAIFPHVHHCLIDGRDVRRSEGVPAYFRRFRRRLGGRAERVEHGALESGDLVERIDWQAASGE